MTDNSAEKTVNTDSAIKAAEDKLQSLSKDEEFMRLYRMREAAIAEWNSDMDHARKEGLLQEIAGKALAEGMPEELISEIISLDINVDFAPFGRHH